MEISKEAIARVRGLNELKVYCFFSDKSDDSGFFTVDKVDYFDLDEKFYVSKTRTVIALQGLIVNGVIERIKRGKYKILL